MTGNSLRAQGIHVEIEIPYKKKVNIQSLTLRTLILNMSGPEKA